ncbi:Hypothetical protein MAK_039 [Escherichia phage vB_Eco_Mak]|nr:Hypothetical protein MAK_039 [Escherichia phage vB_Eco_Mak]CAH7774613.1 hypothetical protein TITUS_037 [Escherichia phage vB_Eco_Titus]
MYLNYSQAMQALLDGYDVIRESTGRVLSVDKTNNNMFAYWPELGEGLRDTPMSQEDLEATDWKIYDHNGNDAPEDSSQFDIKVPVDTKQQQIDELTDKLANLEQKLMEVLNAKS